MFLLADGCLEDDLAFSEMSAVLLGLIAELDTVQQNLLRRHFGFDGGEPESLQDIGESLGLTRAAMNLRKLKIFSCLRKRIPEECALFM